MAKKQVKRKSKQSRKRTVSSSPFYKTWQFLLGVVLVITTISLSPLFNADFVDIDDAKLILDNQQSFKDDPGRIFRFAIHTPHYKPVTYFTWMVEYYVSGNAAWLHHLNNILLHLLNCVLVFFLVRKIAPKISYTSKNPEAIALLSALFFGIHPMHVESVAWAVERKDVLYAAFFLLSMLWYMKYLDTEKVKWILFSTLAFALSIFSKSPAIVLPGVLFLLDWLYKRPFGMKGVTEKWAFYIVTAVALLAFGFFSLGTSEGAIGALAENEIMSTATNAKDLPTLYAKTLIGSMQGVLWYVHSWLPFKLALAYPRESIIGGFGFALHLFPWILLLAAGLLFWKRNTWKLVFFTHVFFLLAMLPAIIRVTPGVGIFLNDRYVYLALFGIVFLLAAILWNLKSATLRTGLIALISLYFIIQSFTLSQTWLGTEDLWTNVIDKYPGVAYAYTNRGSYYREQGEMQRAITDLNKAVEIEADANNLNQRGIILRKLGRQQEALQDYTRAIEMDPDNHQAWLNRGNAYLDLGRLNEALSDINASLERYDQLAKSWVNRGVVNAQLRNYNEAQSDFSKAIELDPNYPDSYLNRGVMYAQLGQTNQAIQDLQRYVQFRPGDHQVWFDIGNLYQSAGNHTNAVEQYSRAIDLSPMPRYFLARATSYQALGNQAAARSDRAAAGQ